MSKLRPPSNRSTLIDRPKLLEKLRETLNRKLALVHGPAGFGKTTLAAQWYAELKDSDISAAWLALDSSDNDINRFLGYLAEAIRLAEPEMAKDLHEVIEANPGRVSDYVVDTLVNDLSLHDADFVLFIDDWHLISEEAVHGAFRLLLTRSPPNLHVVIVSRTRNGIPTTKLLVQGELIEIDAAHLRFDYEESKTYLVDTKDLDLSAEDLMALWRSTEGWAAALQLASMSIRESGDSERILQWTSGSATPIGEYLAENVVSALPADQVVFMLKTSILERLSAGLCVAITGDEDSAARLDSLEQQELFLLPIDEDRRWYRYHHLFSRFLQRRLRKQMPGMLDDLHARASEWFAQNGQTPEAVEHAMRAGQLPCAADLIERVAMGLVENSSMSSLLNLVGRLPRTALFDRPRLQMAIAWANSLMHHPAETAEALWHVERVAASTDAVQRERLLDEANVVRAASLVYADDIEKVEGLVRNCLDRPADFEPWTIGVATNILAYRHIHTFEFSKVEPLLLWARAYQDRAQGFFSGVYGRCFHGIAAWREGNLKSARGLFQDALDVAARSSGRQSNAARLASALLGQMLYEENDLAGAERLLAESRFLGFEGGVVDFYLATYLSSARLAILKGNVEEALSVLDEGKEAARVLSLTRLGVAVACEQVRVKVGTGDISEAERIVDDIDIRWGLERSPRLDSIEIQAYVSLAKSRILCARGRPSLAIPLLEQQVETLARVGWKVQEVAARLLLSIAFDLEGRSWDAECEAIKVVNDAMPRGMLRSILDESIAFVRIVERAVEEERKRLPDDRSDFSALARRLLVISRQPKIGIQGNAYESLKGLTSREVDVLKLLEQGRSNKEIARALSISIDTVKWNLKKIFGKLGVTTRVNAVNEARRRDLLGTVV